MTHERDRKVCPDCGSLNLYHRKRDEMYVCKSRNCSWTGPTPRIQKVLCIPHAYSFLDTQARLKRVREIHTQHPEYTKKDLRMVSLESTHLINKYWKTISCSQ